MVLTLENRFPSMATPHSVAFHTLGCKLNFSETSSIKSQFEKQGFSVVSFDESADIYVINTCSVTESANRKCRTAVRASMKKNPSAKVVVIGCYAQLKPKEIEQIPGVDLVLGAKEKFNILNYVELLTHNNEKSTIKVGDINEVSQFISSYSINDRTRTFLKIQDGCDYKCTFCTIPLARGKSRSNSIEKIVETAHNIGSTGVKEIVLTGVNIGDFGNGDIIDPLNKNKKKENFFELIQQLDQVDNIERIRISSIEPNLCSNEIIEFIADSEKLLPHFHMPLQSASNVILAKMKRRYRRELYEQRVKYIRSLLPLASIGADVLVGFPSESDEIFEDSYHFIQQLDLSYLHVFTYSERPNTLAADMDNRVPINIRRKRSNRLRQLSEVKKEAFYKKNLNRTYPVLFESISETDKIVGYTPNYIKVEVVASAHLINTIQPIMLGSWSSNDCIQGLIVSNLIQSH